MPFYIALNFFENLCEMSGLYEIAESKKVFRYKNWNAISFGVWGMVVVLFVFLFVWGFFPR